MLQAIIKEVVLTIKNDKMKKQILVSVFLLFSLFSNALNSERERSENKLSAPSDTIKTPTKIIKTPSETIKTSADTIKNQADSIKDLKAITLYLEKKISLKYKIGISLGPRRILSHIDEFFRASVTSDSSKVVLDKIDKTSMILSTSISAFPWATGTGKCHLKLKNLGFMLNINIAEIGSAEKFAFNKRIDGGIGIVWKLDDDFAIAVSYEYVANRRLKEWVLKKEGQVILVDGQVVKSIDLTDDKYYMDSGLNAIALKFIFNF